MSVDLARIEVVQSALAHCYNDRGCVSCSMYDECEGDASMIIGIAADVLAEIIHDKKVGYGNGDLISREAAIKAVERRESLMLGDKRVGTDSIKNFLRNRPTVDAEPVRHGRWNIINDGRGGELLECSNCLYTFRRLFPRYYCPNCGAKMDGGAKNESN